MNIYLLSFILLLFSSCDLINFKERKAIKIVQDSKVQLLTDNIYSAALFYNMKGLNSNSTWLDFANIMARENPNDKYSWSARKTSEKGTYIVSFIDSKNWGHNWEVIITDQIVKHINQNEYLSRKHGFSRFDYTYEFTIQDITKDTLKIEKRIDYYSYNTSRFVVYEYRASVLNETDKTITNATIDGTLKLIFKDKTIEENGNWESKFVTRISKSNPWEPNTKRSFYIKTKGIDKLFLNYMPEYVYFEVGLKAEDPIGFNFSKNIAEYDLKHEWSKLSSSNKSSSN